MTVKLSKAEVAFNALIANAQFRKNPLKFLNQLPSAKAASTFTQNKVIAQKLLNIRAAIVTEAAVLKKVITLVDAKPSKAMVKLSEVKAANILDAANITEKTTEYMLTRYGALVSARWRLILRDKQQVTAMIVKVWEKQKEAPKPKKAPVKKPSKARTSKPKTKANTQAK